MFPQLLKIKRKMLACTCNKHVETRRWRLWKRRYNSLQRNINFFYAFDRGQAYIYCLSHSRSLNIYLWKLFPNLSLRANCATIKLIVLSDRSISEIYTKKKIVYVTISNNEKSHEIYLIHVNSKIIASELNQAIDLDSNFETILFLMQNCLILPQFLLCHSFLWRLSKNYWTYNFSSCALYPFANLANKTALSSKCSFSILTICTDVWICHHSTKQTINQLLFRIQTTCITIREEAYVHISRFG